MKALIVTVAGMSGRFNDSIGKTDFLKCLYYEVDEKYSLLYQILQKSYYEADKIILVGGYRFELLENFVQKSRFKDKIVLVYNEKFKLGSMYSLYLGVKKAHELNAQEVIFAEGDLFFDSKTFAEILREKCDTVSVTAEDIQASKSVVFYVNQQGNLRYLYDTGHNILNISEPFKAIYNSGQIWRFQDVQKLYGLNESLQEIELAGTNLVLVQKYFGILPQVKTVKFQYWYNCNTLTDYKSALCKIQEEKCE